MTVDSRSLPTVDNGVDIPRKTFTVPSGADGSGIKVDEIILKRDRVVNLGELLDIRFVHIFFISKRVDLMFKYFHVGFWMAWYISIIFDQTIRRQTTLENTIDG